MFVYYFTGNIIFGATLYNFIIMVVDRPFYSIKNLKRDVKDAKQSQFYNLKDYLENFREEQLESVYEQQTNKLIASIKENEQR